MLYILIETEITAIGKKDSTLSIAFVKDSFCNNLYIPDSKISNEKKKKKKYAQIVTYIITKNFYYFENLIRDLGVPIILSFVMKNNGECIVISFATTINPSTTKPIFHV